MNASLLTALSGALVLVSAAWAEAPDIRTPAPVIHLADNLGEADGLGWCIDTLGRGFGERLQAHSCKPQGGDVQFSPEAGTGLVRSVAFPDFRMRHDPGGETELEMADCDAGDPAQILAHDAAAGSIVLSGDASLCLSVGEAIRQAGPFMSRDLLMASCAGTDPILRTWVVVYGQ